ncbi:MAG: hypothetical protein ABIQ16_11540 [Polyangiaceae bacterium]
MATESEPESGTLGAKDEKQASAKGAPASASDRPKKKKARRPRPPIPKTEAEIDSPSKQTVGMLGILGAMTVIMWALARGGCNYHPPKETRTPRTVTTEELARDPKNAAIELQQRWLTHDFAGALELATGDVSKQVQVDQAACDATCLGQRKELAEKVITSAVVLDANTMGATTRVSSVGLPGGPKVFLMRMERSGSIWKATLRKADDGEALPPLPAPTVSPQELFMPVGGALSSSNATPAGSGTGAAAPRPVLPHMIQPNAAPAASK